MQVIISSIITMDPQQLDILITSIIHDVIDFYMTNEYKQLFKSQLTKNGIVLETVKKRSSSKTNRIVISYNEWDSIFKYLINYPNRNRINIKFDDECDVVFYMKNVTKYDGECEIKVMVSLV